MLSVTYNFIIVPDVIIINFISALFLFYFTLVAYPFNINIDFEEAYQFFKKGQLPQSHSSHK